MEKEELYKLYQSWVERVEKTNPASVVELVAEVINSDLGEEQKLYAIGLILTPNKECYISTLKAEIKKLQGKNKTLENNYEVLKKKHEQKKVKVVIRKGE